MRAILLSLYFTTRAYTVRYICISWRTDVGQFFRSLTENFRPFLLLCFLSADITFFPGAFLCPCNITLSSLTCLFQLLFCKPLFLFLCYLVAVPFVLLSEILDAENYSSIYQKIWGTFSIFLFIVLLKMFSPSCHINCDYLIHFPGSPYEQVRLVSSLFKLLDKVPGWPFILHNRIIAQLVERKGRGSRNFDLSQPAMHRYADS